MSQRLTEGGVVVKKFLRKGLGVFPPPIGRAGKGGTFGRRQRDAFGGGNPRRQS